jgi:hypothetical protein
VLPELIRRGLTAAFFPSAMAIQERKVLSVNKIHYILASNAVTDILFKELKDVIRDYSAKDSRVSPLEVYLDDFFKPSRFDDATVSFIKRVLQHGLPLDLQDEILDEWFHRYVAADQKSFAEDLYLSDVQLKCMLDAGMYIGSHGYSHSWLNKMSIAEQVVDINKSFDFIASINGGFCRDIIMCYPYGGYNEQTLNLLKERNCIIGLTTKAEVANLDRCSPLELPRLDTKDIPTHSI